MCLLIWNAFERRMMAARGHTVQAASESTVPEDVLFRWIVRLQWQSKYDESQICSGDINGIFSTADNVICFQRFSRIVLDEFVNPRLQSSSSSLSSPPLFRSHLEGQHFFRFFLIWMFSIFLFVFRHFYSPRRVHRGNGCEQQWNSNGRCGNRTRATIRWAQLQCHRFEGNNGWIAQRIHRSWYICCSHIHCCNGGKCLI